jgi:hypothetical protein
VPWKWQVRTVLTGTDRDLPAAAGTAVCDRQEQAKILGVLISWGRPIAAQRSTLRPWPIPGLLPGGWLTEARVVVGTAALLAVTAMLALAVGAMLRRSAAAVAAVAAVIVGIVVPYILSTAQVLPLGASEAARGLHDSLAGHRGSGGRARSFYLAGVSNQDDADPAGLGPGLR